MKTRYTVVSLFLALASPFLCSQSAAQTFPSKPVRFVVGYQPGGATDAVARIIGPKLSERLGQPVIVENKPGAESSIATEYCAKAAPDGYTLYLGGSGGMVYNPNLIAKLSYDTVRDFVPITVLVSNALVFAVHPSVPATSINELIAMAKAQSGKMFYSAGATQNYVAGEFFKKLAGVNIVHVPYKGGGPATTAAVAGEVPLVVTSIGDTLTQIRAGRLRALAVTSTRRDPQLPDIPTVQESSGLPLEGGMWVGLFAPAGTPSAVIERVYGDLAVVLDGLKPRLTSLGYDTSRTGMPPAEFGAMFRSEFAKWSKVMKDLDIRAE